MKLFFPLIKSKSSSLSRPCLASKKGTATTQRTDIGRGRCFRQWLLVAASLFAFGSQAQKVLVTTLAAGAGNPDISQYISSPSLLPTLLLTGGNSTESRFVVVRGIIERIAPTPFTITVGNLVDSLPILLMPGMPVQLLSPSQKLSTFNYFRFSELAITGNIDPTSLMINPNQVNANNNIRLPDGTYRVCFTVTDISGEPLTDPGSTCGTFTIACQPGDAVQVTTTTPQVPPGGLSPLIIQDLATGMFPSFLQFRSLNQTCQFSQVKILGKIERLSPSPFTIATNQLYIPSQSYNPGSNQALTPGQQLDAFGNFNEANLSVTGIDLAALRDPDNPSAIRLPDGNYRICFSARYINANGTLAGEASLANRGCALFTICTAPAAAPQFTQPVNSLAIQSQVPVIMPTSPVMFIWTPPQSVCGSPRSGYNYDFEIRELLDNQTVTDVVNNPFVFQKIALPSTTFLLDTNLYRNVLQIGKRYAIRVRAYNASPLDSSAIDNNGYSRVEAFQYGNNPEVVVRTVVPFVVLPPEDYYIPFGERKTDKWDDVYSAYKAGARRDTIIPIQEFIALNLIQNGIAYNTDAIELFLALNPELSSLKQLKLSTRFRLPEFPVLPQQEEKTYQEEHARSLLPDPAESALFRKYLDSLNASGYAQAQGDTTERWIGELATTLNNFSRSVDNVNRVSLNLINNHMAELLYGLRQQNRKDLNHLLSVAANIRELITNSPSSTSSLFPLPEMRQAPQNALLSAMQLSLAGTLMAPIHRGESGLLPVQGPLMPLDVVVWRGATAPPARAITDAPGLRKSFRVFYTTTALYNHKNPGVNASSVPTLASTAQVSLPKMARFKFWTLNMVNHKITTAVEVETSDVFLLNDKKRWPNDKRLHIILKVD